MEQRCVCCGDKAERLRGGLCRNCAREAADKLLAVLRVLHPAQLAFLEQDIHGIPLREWIWMEAGKGA